MYAIVRSGATQQKVAVGDVIEIDKTSEAVGESVTLPVVLLVDGETVTSDADALGKARSPPRSSARPRAPRSSSRSTRTRPATRSARATASSYTQVKVTGISA